MEQSKTLQNVMIRAKGEALRMHGAAPVEEHIYLSLLKISMLSSEKIAPSSAERAAIDAEIRQINEILEKAGVDPVSVEETLRAGMPKLPVLSAAAAEARVQALFNRSAAPAGGKLTAPAVLTALLQSPTELIQKANGGGGLPKPTKRQEQGRSEFWASGNSSVHGPGSQSTPGGTDSNAGAGKFVMPEMPDPNEFNSAAVTVFDLPDEPKPPIRTELSLDIPPEEPKTDSVVDIIDKEDDDAPVKPTVEPPEKKPETAEPKKQTGGAKSEGVDLVAIMRELREKRAHGGDASASGAKEDGPAHKPEQKPEQKPESKPEPVKADIPKPREGVDLAGIMQELRERRIREQKEKSDKTDGGDDDAEPDRGSKPLTVVSPPRTEPAIPAAQTEAAIPDSPKTKKTTLFLGKTYQTGLFGAILLYLLKVVLIQALVLGILGGAMTRFSLETDTVIFISMLMLANIVILAYSLLRILPGLFERSFKPFSLYLDYLLFVGLLVCIVETLFSTFSTLPAWLEIVSKVLAGLFAVGQGARVQERIFQLPNTRGVAREDMQLGMKVFGSPDKIFFQKLLNLSYLPILLLTVYWALNRTLDPIATMALFWFAYAALYAMPRSLSLWYDKDDPLCTKRDEKRDTLATVFTVEIIILAVPAFVLFLTLLYQWRPVPVWTILVYCIFGLIGAAVAVAAIMENRKT